MKTAEITYTGELSTQSVHLKSGKTILTDAPPDNNGKGEAFSPTDLLATSLGCCMLTVMGIAANRHKLNIDGTKAEITKIMKSDPRRVGEIIVEIQFPKGRSYSDAEKKLLEQTALTCPVAKSLHPEIIQTVSFLY